MNGDDINYRILQVGASPKRSPTVSNGDEEPRADELPKGREDVSKFRKRRLRVVDAPRNGVRAVARRRRRVIALPSLRGQLAGTNGPLFEGQLLRRRGSEVPVGHGRTLFYLELSRVARTPRVAASLLPVVCDAVEVLVGDQIIRESVGTLVESLSLEGLVRPRCLIHGLEAATSAGPGLRVTFDTLMYSTQATTAVWCSSILASSLPI